MAMNIALAGNPNCGKTTLFNDLTGASQYVGNWPGVTVEKKEGKYRRDKEVTITDLPGIYSLSPYTPEEIVTRDYLTSDAPDAVVNIIDATNIERNLYLTTQIIDLGLPTVIALNMMDLVRKNGDKIDVDALSKQLGCPIVEISALRNDGVDKLMEAAVQAAKSGTTPDCQLRFAPEVEQALSQVEDIIKPLVPTHTLRWYAIKLLEDEQLTIDALQVPAESMSKIVAIREGIESSMDDDAESIITNERYDALTELCDKYVDRKPQGLTTTQKIDRVVTNRVAGIPIFIVIMFFVYWLAVSVGGGVVTDWANDGISGDGWLYTGGDKYEAAVEEWEGAQEVIEEYVIGIAGTTADGDPSEDAEAIFAAMEVEEPEEPEADEDGVLDPALSEEYEDAMAEYDEAQDVIAAFEEEAESSNEIVMVETEDENGEVVVEEIDYDAYLAASEIEEPDPASGEFGMWIPGLSPVVTEALESIDAAPWVISLVVDGIIAGVGAVIGFIPQLIILFLLLGILEGCGYMARVAFIMDRIFRRFGLSGKSFIPMLIASGCGVPAVMATKTIENEKDRRMTIMTTTMIPCGAKLPIIALVFGALAGSDYESTWWVAPLFYFLGLAAIIISCIMLKKFKAFAGEVAPFIMELPQYHLPTVKSVLLSMWERVKSYIVKAGTIIFLSAMVIWFMLNFGVYDGQFGLLDSDMDDYIQYSIMAGFGNLLAWIFAPLGFGNWEATVTSITGLVAKENVVATVGILTAVGEEAGETDPSLWHAFGLMLGGSSIAIMAFCAFNLLCAPCFAAMGAIRNQMRSARWFWAAVGYMCVFAWCVALMIYQLGGLATGEVGFNFWTIIAVLVAALMLFLLFRPTPKYDKPVEPAAKDALPTAA